jgi:predicted nucleotidyltransferase
MNALDEYRAAIAKRCESHKLKRLYAFGSVLTDRLNPGSDIDFVVEFSAITAEDYPDNHFDFKFSLQDILNCRVDLLEEKAIKNPYFKQAVNQQRQLVYGR